MTAPMALKREKVQNGWPWVMFYETNTSRGSSCTPRKSFKKMETCPVRFDFNAELQGKVKYVHNIPRSLVTPTALCAA